MKKWLILALFVIFLGQNFLFARDPFNDSFDEEDDFVPRKIKGRSAPKTQAVKSKPSLLREGMILSGVEGTLIRSSYQNKIKWLFASYADISDTRVVFPAGTHIQMIPSSVMEKMIQEYKAGDPNSNQQDTSDLVKSPLDKENKIHYESFADVRLWARVTKYKGRNFLMPVYYLPLSQTEPEPSASPAAAVEKKKPESILPEDIEKKLNPKRTVNLAEIKSLVDSEQDVIMADRTGFIVRKQNESYFEIDGFGRNVENILLKMLPSESFQQVEKSLASTVWRQRYRVSGIITKYKGQYYLLMQRAVRTYSHGNFGR